MTFDRFYSIIRPHKAASFNTIKRAKITIVSIIVISILYNIPHLFISSHEHWECLPYGLAMEKPYGQVYYWLSFVIHYALPFVLLLCMNSVIIHEIKHRSVVQNQIAIISFSQNSNRQPNLKGRNSDRQTFAILLLVTFGFLILTTPGYILFLFIMFVDFLSTPELFAGYYLFWNVAHKLHTTNHGINFFLYVISGQKFRTDLVKLFVNRKEGSHSQTSTISNM